MKFITAWSNIASENVALKFVCLVQGLSLTVLAGLTVSLFNRPPLIIERECTSKKAAVGPLKHTESEIESFVRMAISKRFDSDATDYKFFLSEEEFVFREKEQEELARKNFTQRILIVGSFKADKSEVRIDSDRLIAMGNTRTAIPFPITVSIAKVERTAMNPYGLILERASMAKTDEVNPK